MSTEQEKRIMERSRDIIDQSNRIVQISDAPRYKKLLFRIISGIIKRYLRL